EATDGGIGQAVDCLVDDTDWTIRYLVVDTGNWLPGKQVLVAPDWIDQVDWNGSRIYIKMTQAQIKRSPEYDSSALPDPQYEQSLHDHYSYQAR
ncbi:MAG: PRC-barrel domain containing protein, partial [Chloroflexota bacterium]|nr:PRC-barrel domain containing protein [Chloroflexota bacterium]